MKHKLIFAFLLVGGLLFATSMQAQNLVLRLQSGTDQTIPLNNLQKITFSNNNLVLNYVSGGTQAYGFSSLEKLFFSSSTALVETTKPSANILFNSTDNQIHFRNLAEGRYPMAVYRTDGVTVFTKTISNNESVDMSGYPAGIYLIRIDNQVLKFKK